MAPERPVVGDHDVLKTVSVPDTVAVIVLVLPVQACRLSATDTVLQGWA